MPKEKFVGKNIEVVERFDGITCKPTPDGKVECTPFVRGKGGVLEFVGGKTVTGDMIQITTTDKAFIHQFDKEED